MYIYIYIGVCVCKGIPNIQRIVYQVHAHGHQSEFGTCARMDYACEEPIPSVCLAQDSFVRAQNICIVAERLAHLFVSLCCVRTLTRGFK